MIQKPSTSNQLALILEQFVAAAEAFLQNHYTVGSDSEDVTHILKAIANLQLDVETEQLESEFELNHEKKDLMAEFWIKF